LGTPVFAAAPPAHAARTHAERARAAARAAGEAAALGVRSVAALDERLRGARAAAVQASAVARRLDEIAARTALLAVSASVEARGRETPAEGSACSPARCAPWPSSAPRPP
jgi:hypothetical protein